MMPLQVVYVNETRATKNRGASFGFGSGTLQGHLLVTSFSLILLVFFYSSYFVAG
jgi:lipoprotein signal peptidase